MFDSILLLSFGGPEKPEDVMPFLENVTRGRGIPHERLLEVAEHYHHFGGVSPINQQCRELIAALKPELESHGIRLPIYWGNRNWHPFLRDTLLQMKADGRSRALVLVTSAFSSYSGCRQYREDLAKHAVPGLETHKIRPFFNHPGFVESIADLVTKARAAFDEPFHFVATAHSVPLALANSCDYVAQLQETARLVAEASQLPIPDLVFQSRSGPPAQPWLEPDILDHLRALHAQGVRNVLVSPIGFVSDHLEVLYDLDTEAAALAKELGMNLVRAASPGVHPAYVRAMRELIEERLYGQTPVAIGKFPSRPDDCAESCCPAPAKRP